MSQFIHRYYKEEWAVYELIVRSGQQKLTTSWLDLGEVREQMKSLSALSFRPQEIEDLRRILPEVSPGFYMGLESIKLNVSVGEDNDGNLQIRCAGKWWAATFCETFIMSILNELLSRTSSVAEQTARWQKKRMFLVTSPDLQVIDFGTRRRASKVTQRGIVSDGIETGALKGTSNVEMALMNGLTPIGTMAHELFMGVAALYDHAPTSLRGTQQIVLRQWQEMYKDKLLIALTDTWNSEFFFQDFTNDQAYEWEGLRHDSGDPYTFTKSALSFYAGKDEITRKKIVYSDGLTLSRIVSLHDHFSKQIQCVFGWGTDLTNDCGTKVPSIVVKLMSLNGRDTVKLSDEPSKWLGSTKKISQYFQVFGSPKVPIVYS